MPYLLWRHRASGIHTFSFISLLLIGAICSSSFPDWSSGVYHGPRTPRGAEESCISESDSERILFVGPSILELRVASDGYVTKVALFIDTGEGRPCVASPLSAHQRPDAAEAGRKKDEIYDYEGRIWRSNMQAGRGNSCVLHAPPKVECSVVDFLLPDMTCAAIYPSACLLSENLGQGSTKSLNKKSVIKLKVN